MKTNASIDIELLERIRNDLRLRERNGELDDNSVALLRELEQAIKSLKDDQKVDWRKIRRLLKRMFYIALEEFIRMTIGG